MRTFIVFLIYLSALVGGLVQAAEQSHNSGDALANKDILFMLKAGLTPEVVIAKIKLSDCNFDTSPSALKDLKGAGVSDTVILAMVQAPAYKATMETEITRSNENTEAKGESAFIYCGGMYNSLRLSDKPLSSTAVATLACNEPASVLGEEAGWKKIRISGGKVGYIEPSHLSSQPEKKVAASADGTSATESKWNSGSPNVPTRTPILPPGTVKALAYRVVPQQQTSYYQSGSNSSYTSCFGQGQFSNFGNYGNINMNTNCNTTFTTPTQIPVTWKFADVFVVVEGSNQLYLIGCRANWRWSNCKPLIVGEVFPAEVSGGTMTLTATKNGKKEIHAKYNILQVNPK
jgi:hypothetical protein